MRDFERIEILEKDLNRTQKAIYHEAQRLFELSKKPIDEDSIAELTIKFIRMEISLIFGRILSESIGKYTKEQLDEDALGSAT